MAKTNAMENLLDELSGNLFGTTRRSALENAECVICKEKAVEFRDRLSFQEYKLTGMCQLCQDATFED